MLDSRIRAHPPHIFLLSSTKVEQRLGFSWRRFSSSMINFNWAANHCTEYLQCVLCCCSSSGIIQRIGMNVDAWTQKTKKKLAPRWHICWHFPKNRYSRFFQYAAVVLNVLPASEANPESEKKTSKMKKKTQERNRQRACYSWCGRIHPCLPGLSVLNVWTVCTGLSACLNSGSSPYRRSHDIGVVFPLF